jgi:hypothetical protein
MTGRELVALAGSQPVLLVVLCAAPALLALLLRFVHARGDGGRAPWKFVYSVLVYVACVPGTGAAVLTAYTLFFSGENLLDLNLLVYLLPIAGMAAALLVISRNVPFDAIPGFDRLSGLMVMLAMAFILALAVAKTRIWLVFGGSLGMLLLLVAGIFALLKWGAHMAFRRSDEPKREPPAFPEP